MKVSELESPIIDYWVATKQEDDWVEILWHKHQKQWYWVYPDDSIIWVPFYSQDLSACAPLIEKYKPDLIYRHDNSEWECFIKFGIEDLVYEDSGVGPTPQIAICRAVLASCFGEEVPDIKE